MVEIEPALESGKSFTRYVHLTSNYLKLLPYDYSMFNNFVIGQHNRYAINKLRCRERHANTHEVNIYDYQTGLCDVTSRVNPLTLKCRSTHRVKLSVQTRT